MIESVQGAFAAAGSPNHGHFIVAGWCSVPRIVSRHYENAIVAGCALRCRLVWSRMRIVKCYQSSCYRLIVHQHFSGDRIGGTASIIASVSAGNCKEGQDKSASSHRKALERIKPSGAESESVREASLRRSRRLHLPSSRRIRTMPGRLTES